MKSRFTFRAWVSGQMVYFKLGDGMPPNWGGWNDCMQNTGLVDRQGKEIYEGDVVKGQGQVVWNNEVSNFAFEGTVLSLGYFKTEVLEIIGNIYSDPHLLNQEQK